MMIENDHNAFHRGGWRSAMFVWAAVALILGSTYVLVFVPGLAPEEWVTAITFMAAHLMAAEVIIAGHRRR